MDGHFPGDALKPTPVAIPDAASPGARHYRPALLDVARTDSPAGDGIAIKLRSLTARGAVAAPGAPRTAADAEGQDTPRFVSETEAVILVTREQGMRLLADLAAAMGMIANPPAASPAGLPAVPSAAVSDRPAIQAALEPRPVAPMATPDGPAVGVPAAPDGPGVGAPAAPDHAVNSAPAATGGSARFGQQPLFQADPTQSGDGQPRRPFGKRVLDPMAVPAAQEVVPGHGAPRPVEALPGAGRSRGLGFGIGAVLLTGAVVAGGWFAAPGLMPGAERQGLAAEPVPAAASPDAPGAGTVEPRREQQALAAPAAASRGEAGVLAIAVVPPPGQGADPPAAPVVAASPVPAGPQGLVAPAPGGSLQELPASAPTPPQGLPASSAPSAAAAPPRLLLRVRSDSWIQVRDGRGEILVARMMRAGEEWVPPATPGLRLTTGNAAGTEILVDGVALPALGPVGQVRRDIPLEARRP